MGPITMTPIMPLMTGLPPTMPTAIGRSFSNQGVSRYDSMIEIPLNIPK
jgi:hypothetical protein